MKKWIAILTAAFLCSFTLLPVYAEEAAGAPQAPSVVTAPYSGALAGAPQYAAWAGKRIILTDGANTWSFPLSDLGSYPVTFTVPGTGQTCKLSDISYIREFVRKINTAYEVIPTLGTETIYLRDTDTYTTASTGMFLQIRREFPQQLAAAVEQQLASNPVPDDITVNLNGGFLVGFPVGGRIITAGSCTTSLSSSSSNRISNVSVAASRINNLVLMPGEEISISTAILPRTTANGYKEAGVYLNGETVPGLGGGICQLSSTTYNAAITSGLTILERHPHSMPVSYLRIGLDAAISAGSKDLRFRNDYDLPVTLMAGVEGRRLTVSVCMNEYLLNGKTYKLWSTIPSHNVAKTYLSTYLGETEIAQIYVGTSRYSDPKPKVVNED